MLNHSITKNQLKWQCRRGMLELDLILNQFLESQYDALTPEQSSSLYQLLKEEVDPEIYAWLFCDATVPAKLQNIVQRIYYWKKNDYSA